MSPQELEKLLADLPAHGTLIKRGANRQVWRFSAGDRGYFLKFYPRPRGLLKAATWKQMLRGSPALKEFSRLQALQRAKIPSPRAIAHLGGFVLDGVRGDALVLDAIEPAVALDRYYNDHLLRGQWPVDHRAIVGRVIELVQQLIQAGLSHNDLHPGNLLWKEGRVFLLDGYAVRRRTPSVKDLLQLAHGARRFCTVTDLLRGWLELGPPGAPLPRQNKVGRRVWRKFLERADHDENAFFGTLTEGDWSGTFFKRVRYPRRWAALSAADFTRDDFALVWKDIRARVEVDNLEILKRSASGDVLGGDIVLAGKPVSVVIKRPKRRDWLRYFTQIGPNERGLRSWRKSWELAVRDLPTAWPLLLMRRKKFGYVTDAVLVSALVPGPTLASVDLEELSAGDRDRLFRRTGRVLRQIEEYGFSHFDAKSSNWIVHRDPILGPVPVLIDVDGIRRRQWRALGLERLLRAMKSHPQYSPADSLALCQGYAPWSRIAAEKEGA